MSVNNENETKKEYGKSFQNQDWFQKYILNNLSIKVVSLLAAIIAWMLIVNIEDPYKEKTFMVTVETINEDALSSVNKVYEVIEGSTASVKVKGKKSVVDKLKTSDIRATADLSNLSAVNAVAIVPHLMKNVSSEPTLECTQVLKVRLEDMASKQVKVTVMTEGTPEQGYSVGDCMSRPNMIEVTGGQSAINKIDSVRVVVNVNGASQDFTRKVEPVAYDENGEEVVSSTLRFGVNKIRAIVHILNTKTIPVNIKIKGKPADGYEFVKAECLPEKIEIAGDSKSLDSISGVEIPIDITGMKSSSGAIEQNISIQDYLPEGVSVLSEYAQVSLRIEIEKQMQKTITVPIASIKFASLNTKLNAEIVKPETQIEAVVQGRASVLDSLTENSYTAYIDCEGLKEGRYVLEVKFNLEDSYTLIQTDKVTVKITKGSQSNDSSLGTVPETTPEVTQTPAKTEEPVSEEGEEE